MLLFDFSARRVDVFFSCSEFQHAQILGRSFRLRGGVVVLPVRHDAVVIKRFHSPAIALVVCGDRFRFRDLLRTRSGDSLLQTRFRCFDDGLLFGDLSIDRFGFDRRDDLAGDDVRAFIDEDAGDSSADERPDVHRPCLQRSGEDELARLSFLTQPDERRDSRRHDYDRDDREPGDA